MCFRASCHPDLDQGRDRVLLHRLHQDLSLGKREESLFLQEGEDRGQGGLGLFRCLRGDAEVGRLHQRDTEVGRLRLEDTEVGLLRLGDAEVDLLPLGDTEGGSHICNNHQGDSRFMWLLRSMLMAI